MISMENCNASSYVKGADQRPINCLIRIKVSTLIFLLALITYLCLPNAIAQSTFTRRQYDEQLFSNPNLEATRLIRDDIYSLEQVASATQFTLMRKIQANVYSDLVSHRYDDPDELKASGGPEVDHERCLAQLDNIIQRTIKLRNEKSLSKDISLHRLLDTFGRVPSNVYGGDSLWAGHYPECKTFQMSLPDSGNQSFRYCLVRLRDPHWRLDWPLEQVIGYETGVCLPTTCDSVDYKNKFELIDKLINLNDGEISARELQFSALYCLPDERSTLRVLTHSPGTMKFLLVIALWLCAIVLATVRLFLVSAKRKGEIGNQLGKNSKIVEAFALTKNLRELFDLGKVATHTERSRRSVDLNCVEGIKVIFMMSIVCSHVSLVSTIVFRDIRVHFDYETPAFFIPYSMATTSVNAFFVITGILTAYTVLKKDQLKPFLSKPGHWFGLIVSRYLQVMPMYLIVVFYAKYLAKHMGSGPIWNYGTSDLSFRRRCEKESLLSTLTMSCNIKPALEHCVPTAWYLANDFQFLLVTPIIFYVLHLNRTAGKWFIKLLMVIGSLYSAYATYTLEADLRPISRTESHACSVVGVHLTKTYAWPFSRIASYLMGLLFGLELFNYERSSEIILTKSNNHQGDLPVDLDTSNFDVEQKHRPASIAAHHSAKKCIIIFFWCISQPFIGWLTKPTLTESKISLSIFLVVDQLLSTYAVGSYIVLAATYHKSKRFNRFLSSSVWRPLSKLSLCASLINLEVCLYFILHKLSFQSFNWFNQAPMIFLCILVTYVVATLMHLIFEAPIRQLLSLGVHSMTKKTRSGGEREKSD